MTGVRGEFALVLGERKFTLVPEFGRIRRLEAALGRSLICLMNDLEAGRGLTVADAAALVCSLCEDDPAPTTDEVGEAILRHGIVSVLPAVGTLLTRVLVGGAKGTVPKGERAAHRS